MDIYDPATVSALFDRCSARYRRWSMVSSLGFIWIWRRQCVARLVGQRQIGRMTQGSLTPEATAAPRVIDLMAGTGEVWPHLLAALPRARITAIDISHGMHLDAVARLHATRAEKITHIEANALTTDLPTGMADAVISTFGLKTFNKPQQTILAAQVARLLRPGGSFSLIEASDPRGWVFRPLYRFYFTQVFPRVERTFLRGAQDFSMIGTYTLNFGDCGHFEQALRDAGLAVTMKRHFFGCATSVAGTKPIADGPPTP